MKAYYKEIARDIGQAIKEYFELNNTGEVSPLMTWEAHKAFIRGLLIKHGVRMKKKRQQEITD